MDADPSAALYVSLRTIATSLTCSRRSFPGQSSPDLYAALSLSATATSAEIKSAYRRSALLFHPDKLAQGASEEEKEEGNRKFQQIGFAYAVLKDEEKRKRYDSTGRTDEGFGGAKTEQGWKDYFKAVWTGEVNAKTVEEFTKKYQGSSFRTLTNGIIADEWRGRLRGGITRSL